MVEEREPGVIELNPESQLAKVLATAGRQPVSFMSGGRRYVASRDPHDWDAKDAEAFSEALRAVAGTFTPEEGERLKQDIYRWREEGTRPIDRPDFSSWSERDSNHGR
jgi:hypothetical protein